MFILGIDIGTQSLKAVVLGEGLTPLGGGAASYQPQFPQPLWAEQDPRLWLEALRPAIGQALAEAGIAAAEVGALGIAGQLDGCLPVDRKGEAMGPCLIWMDRRASAETSGVAAETVMAKGGVVLDASHMAAKICWLKRHHGDARDIARFHQPTSYVVARLTGRAVLDHAVASTSMLYNLWDRRLDPELCEMFGIEPGELPEIDASEAVAGGLSAAGAALTGLKPGIPVAVGTGDDFSNALGAGVVRPGRVIVSLGTAEVVGAVHGTAVIDKGALVETHGYAGKRFFIENPGWLSGGALAWITGTLRLTGVEELNELAGSGAARRRWRHLPAGALRRHGAGMGGRGPRLLLRPHRRPWPRASHAGRAGRLCLCHARRGRPADGARRRYQSGSPAERRGAKQGLGGDPGRAARPAGGGRRPFRQLAIGRGPAGGGGRRRRAQPRQRRRQTGPADNGDRAGFGASRRL